MSHLQIFYHVVYALIDSHNHRKLDDKSVKCVFIGYCVLSKAYILYNPVGGKIFVSRNIVFYEKASWPLQENLDTVQTENPVKI